MALQLTPESYYQLRDDRTNRIVDNHGYGDFCVRLICNPKRLHDFNVQVQLIVAANLLARWCRRIEVGFPDASLAEPLKRSRVTSIHERIEMEVKQADPFGQYHIAEKPSTSDLYTLGVGGTPAANEAATITIHSDGWCAYADRGDTALTAKYVGNNPAAAAFAACIGVADAFKVATGLSDGPRVSKVCFSLFDFQIHSDTVLPEYPPVTDQVDLGSTQIIGLGSVGSAVVYLLDMLDIKGDAKLIDHDTVKIENLNRSPLYGFEDIGRNKVEAAAAWLDSSLPVIAYPLLYDEFVAKYGRLEGALDLILPLANEFGVRHTIENNLPPIQIYGTTTSDWGVNYHRHIPLRDDCSCCRFPRDVQPAEMVCSTAKVETPEGEHVDAALPFCSVAAAALTVADIMKLEIPGYPFTPNFAFVDFKGELGFVPAHNKGRRKTCICASRSSGIHKSCIASSKFFALSRDE